MGEIDYWGEKTVVSFARRFPIFADFLVDVFYEC